MVGVRQVTGQCASEVCVGCTYQTHAIYILGRIGLHIKSGLHATTSCGFTPYPIASHHNMSEYARYSAIISDHGKLCQIVSYTLDPLPYPRG